MGNDVFAMGIFVDVEVGLLELGLFDAAEGLELGWFDAADRDMLGIVELEGAGRWLGFTECDEQASQVSAQFKMTSS